MNSVRLAGAIAPDEFFPTFMIPLFEGMDGQLLVAESKNGLVERFVRFDGHQDRILRVKQGGQYEVNAGMPEIVVIALSASDVRIAQGEALELLEPEVSKKASGNEFFLMEYYALSGNRQAYLDAALGAAAQLKRVGQHIFRKWLFGSNLDDETVQFIVEHLNLGSPGSDSRRVAILNLRGPKPFIETLREYLDEEDSDLPGNAFLQRMPSSALDRVSADPEYKKVTDYLTYENFCAYCRVSFVHIENVRIVRAVFNERLSGSSSISIPMSLEARNFLHGLVADYEEHPLVQRDGEAQLYMLIGAVLHQRRDRFISSHKRYMTRELKECKAEIMDLIRERLEALAD